MRIGPHTETFNDHVLFTAHWGHYWGPNEADKSTKFFQEQILLPLTIQICGAKIWGWVNLFSQFKREFLQFYIFTMSTLTWNLWQAGQCCMFVCAHKETEGETITDVMTLFILSQKHLFVYFCTFSNICIFILVNICISRTWWFYSSYLRNTFLCISVLSLMFASLYLWIFVFHRHDDSIHLISETPCFVFLYFL